MSGLNSGNCPSSANNSTDMPGGAKRATARSNAELLDAALRLPDMARIFMTSVVKFAGLAGSVRGALEARVA
jgi:hypothetical protein